MHSRITSTATVPVPHCPSCTCTTSLAPETTPQDLHSADDAILRLTEEIKMNTETLYRLKRERNARLPLARVPPEILAEIFLAFRSVSTKSSNEYSARIGWAPVIHVSSHWRAVALSDPRLWNTPNLRFPTFVDHFIQYSGALPLRVVVSSPILSEYSLDVSALETVSAVNNPITVLELYGTKHELLDCIDWLIPECSGGLRFLDIGLEINDEDDTTMLHTLWKHSLSNLRRLGLEGTCFEWASVMMKSCSSSLRELRLCNCQFNADLSILTSLPYLAKLEIENFSGGAGDDSQKILLAALRELLLDDAPSLCLRILHRLTLSPWCCTTVVDSCEGLPVFRHDVEGLVGCISSRCPTSMEIQFRQEFLDLRCTTADRVQHRLQFFLKHRDDENILFAAGVLPLGVERLSIYVREDQNIATDMLSTFCTRMAASVRTLTVGGNNTLLDALAGCLAHHETFLPNLARLNIEGSDLSKLSSAAAQRWRDGVAARRAVLERIVLYECTGSPPTLPEGQELPISYGLVG